jgi:hypothetical protein
MNAGKEQEMKATNRIVSTRTVDLGHEQLLILEGERDTRIKVIYGGMWLTEEGYPNDVFASREEEVALRTRGKAVIEALRPTRIEVLGAGRTLRARVKDAWHTLRRMARGSALRRALLPRTAAMLLAVAAGTAPFLAVLDASAAVRPDVRATAPHVAEPRHG